jgi:hypothetical protein
MERQNDPGGDEAGEAVELLAMGPEEPDQVPTQGPAASMEPVDRAGGAATPQAKTESTLGGDDADFANLVSGVTQFASMQRTRGLAPSTVTDVRHLTPAMQSCFTACDEKVCSNGNREEFSHDHTGYSSREATR